MRVLLLRDIPNVGDEGDVRDVSDGYARNFLFPANAAVPATEDALRAARARAAARKAESERDLHVVQGIASRVDGQEVNIRMPATAAGRLYGGVGVAAIATALRAAGFDVEESWVALAKPIREVGTHDVFLRLPHGLEAAVVVIIEAAS